MFKIWNCLKYRVAITLKPTGFCVKWPMFGNLWSISYSNTRVTKKVADLPSQNFWLGGNYLNYYYHPVRAPPRDKQSCSLCGIDIISLLINSCSILCSNISKMRCFACSLSQCGSEL